MCANDHKHTGGFSTAMGAARILFRERGARKCAYKVAVKAISVAAWSDERNVFCSSKIEIVDLNATVGVGVLPRLLSCVGRERP
jgi:hypothetical protein